MLKSEKKQELLDLAYGEFNQTGSCLDGEVKESEILEKMRETSDYNTKLMISGELSFNDIHAARDEYQELVNDAIEAAVNDVLFEDEMNRLGL